MVAARSLTALLFPGQGSQTEGMREAVERWRPALLEQTIDELGTDPFERVNEGTAFAQPALYCAGLAGWAAAGEPEARFAAGHSLGELTALAAAGCLSEAAGLSLAVARGQAMQEAAKASPLGGMLAVLGDSPAASRAAERLGLTVANDNAPGQLVLSGSKESLEMARAELKAARVKTKRLKVQGAFHSPAMASALPAFQAALAEVEFAPPSMPVLSSTTASEFDDVRARLADALTLPVRWRETLLSLHRLGVRRFLETGPGSVLTALVRRTLDGADARPIGVLEAAGA